ncbi:unnamed protein product [Thelazia callipaeda]|uniref:BHLH domain-containing protein n=1 Tax=Thelazia callipaeda TaxID=103827 RepID=A0A0N5CT55_THECL|nr:unnamed protein product [Thelazia callipaeda]
MRLLSSPSSSNGSSESGASEVDSNVQIRSGRIRKLSRKQRQQYEILNVLRKMVPNANSATTLLEFMQYTIDYIAHLQQLLSDSDENMTVRSASGSYKQQNSKTIANLSMLFTKMGTANRTSTPVNAIE